MTVSPCLHLPHTGGHLASHQPQQTAASHLVVEPILEGEG